MPRLRGDLAQPAGARAGESAGVVGAAGRSVRAARLPLVSARRPRRRRTRPTCFRKCSGRSPSTSPASAATGPAPPFAAGCAPSPATRSTTTSAACRAGRGPPAAPTPSCGCWPCRNRFRTKKTRTRRDCFIGRCARRWRRSAASSSLRTWQAFWKVQIEGRSTADVGAELGMTAGRGAQGEAARAAAVARGTGRSGGIVAANHGTRRRSFFRSCLVPRPG